MRLRRSACIARALATTECFCGVAEIAISLPKRCIRPAAGLADFLRAMGIAEECGCQTLIARGQSSVCSILNATTQGVIPARAIRIQTGALDRVGVRRSGYRCHEYTNKRKTFHAITLYVLPRWRDWFALFVGWFCHRVRDRARLFLARSKQCWIKGRHEDACHCPIEKAQSVGICENAPHFAPQYAPRADRGKVNRAKHCSYKKHGKGGVIWRVERDRRKSH